MSPQYRDLLFKVMNFASWKEIAALTLQVEKSFYVIQLQNQIETMAERSGEQKKEMEFFKERLWDYDQLAQREH